MGKIYLTRHGQTIWNVENKVCGATDIELTELGHKQAMEAGEIVKGLPIEKILTSPLVRAKNTAQHISEVSGIPMEIEELLREQNFGIYEGGARDAADFLEAKKQFVNRFETGESMMMLAKRIYTLLDRLKADSDTTYLLVAHNGIARIVHSYFEDMTNEEFAKYSMKNCEIKCYEWK